MKSVGAISNDVPDRTCAFIYNHIIIEWERSLKVATFRDLRDPNYVLFEGRSKILVYRPREREGYERCRRELKQHNRPHFLILMGSGPTRKNMFRCLRNAFAHACFQFDDGMFTLSLVADRGQWKGKPVMQARLSHAHLRELVSAISDGAK